jgi:hypothetical protein
MPENHDPVLAGFGKSVIALAELLEQDPAFGPMEQMLIENHLHILHMAYHSWKRRQNPGQEVSSIPISD